MADTTIKSVRALEIFDSRGNHPMVRVLLELEDGTKVSSSVPSGASTGEYEAVELRDNDPQRYDGEGALKAVSNVNTLIAPLVIGMDTKAHAEFKSIPLTPRSSSSIKSERSRRRSMR